MEKIKYVNKSHRELPAELLSATDGNITYECINSICDEYNLKVIEYEKVFDRDANSVEQIFVIGDING